MIDEILTPDSSRFWSARDYRVGKGQDSFDKQIVRDYLLTLNWNQQPPGPKLPEDIIEKAGARYKEILGILTTPSPNPLPQGRGNNVCASPMRGEGIRKLPLP